MPFRNMTIEDLARHLGMDARELRKWADRGRLPGQMVGGQWRFNRAQMLDWLQQEMHTLTESQIRSLERAMSDGPEAAVVSALIPPDGIELNLAARSKASTLRELVRVAERSGLVYDGPALVAALEDRDEMGTTALPGGLAFPHPRRPMPYATAESLVCVARVVAGVPFGAPDGRLTDLFVLICSHDDRTHLRVLARLALMFISDLAEKLRAAESKEEALTLLVEAERRALAVRS